METLGSFLEEYSEKNTANNLQSVAVGKYGIRKREDIYSKELSSDYSKNKVIRKNTLIIGMGSTQIDIGILTTDNCYCVSPAYTTYRIKGVDSFYLRKVCSFNVRYVLGGGRGIHSCLLQSNLGQQFLCFAKAFGQPLKTTHRVVFLTLSFESLLLSSEKTKRTSKKYLFVLLAEEEDSFNSGASEFTYISEASTLNNRACALMPCI